MEAKFETAFVKALKKHNAIRKHVERKVRMIMEHPVAMGEPLKGNFRGFYSCPVRKNFLIIYLYCSACRKKGDDAIVACFDCDDCSDETIKFILLATHNDAYNKKF